MTVASNGKWGIWAREEGGNKKSHVFSNDRRPGVFAGDGERGRELVPLGSNLDGGRSCNGNIGVSDMLAGAVGENSGPDFPFEFGMVHTDTINFTQDDVALGRT